MVEENVDETEANYISKDSQEAQIFKVSTLLKSKKLGCFARGVVFIVTYSLLEAGCSQVVTEMGYDAYKLFLGCMVSCTVTVAIVKNYFQAMLNKTT